MSSQKLAKAALRKAVRASLSKLTEAEIDQQSSQIALRLTQLPVFQSSKVVSVYLNMPKAEAATHDVLQHCFSSGKRVLVPVIDKAADTMVMVELYSLADLDTCKRNAWGIPEPSLAERRPRALDAPSLTLDLIVTPGLFFDRHGHRLGHGKGYYDRFHQACALFSQSHSLPMPKFVAIALTQQLAPVGHELPHEATDALIDGIVTPDQVLQFQRL